MCYEKIKFEKMTPYVEADVSDYEDAIDFAFEENDIKNIALSGAYGAGKSSILETYKKKREEEGKAIKFIHISLAHFQEDGEENDVKESMIEMKILNQLMYQIPIEKIPQTKFQLKKKTRMCEVVSAAVIGMVYIIAYLYFAYIDKLVEHLNPLVERWKLLIEKNEVLEKWKILFIYFWEFSSDNGIMFEIAFGIMLVFLTGWLLVKVIKYHKSKGILKRLQIKNTEIEFDYVKTESFFDTYLNEVLYLFENSGARAIVFEDIDRFDKKKIFERLREINTLVNNKILMEQENGSTIKFFYLLRDDIFDSKERIKFFDFIIPIVPVISGHNSYPKLHELFIKNGEVMKVSDGFLKNISNYIEDMRFLKNIYNEFCIYSRKLNVNIIEADKLLAMVIYKNLFPKDYIKTQFKQGEVSAVIEKTKEENPTSNWKEILEGNCISKVLDELKNDTELKKNPYYTAIRFLLIQGYIDENYQDYIVYTNGSRRGSNRAQEILKNILAYIDISNEEEIYECYCFYSEESSDYANVGNIIKYLLDKQAIYKSILDRILNEKISKEDYSFIANTLKYIGNYNNYVLYIYECLKENWDSMVSFMDTEDMITNITIIGVYFRSFLPKQLCGDTKTTFVNNSKSLNLKMANLEKADLSSIRLAWAHLEDAHLEGAHLEGAHLGGANLEGANLKGAHLEEVHLEAANLEGANLEDTNLEGAHLGGAHLKRANLKKANLKRANLEDTNLEDTNLEGAHLEGANLKGAHLEGANLKGAHLEEVHLEGANLESANLR